MKSRIFTMALATFMSASMWFYVQRIQIAYQVRDAAAHEQPRGNFSDLYPRWLGARELLLHHRDPYSPELTREIQQGYYGRALDPNRASDPHDQQAFAYPLYVVFLLAPFVYMPFHAVQVIAFWGLLVITGASVLLWLQAFNWRPSGLTIATLIILTLGSFPAVQALKLQQLTLLVAALLAASFALLRKGRLVLAGVLFAISTIKPQLVVLPIVWLSFWASGNLKVRWRMLAAFAATMAALVLSAQFIYPGWIPRFINALREYRQYTGGAETSLDTLLTPLLGRIVAVLLILIVLTLCWRLRKSEPGSSSFSLLIALVLSVTITAIPKVAPYNQLLLLPAVLFVAHHWVSWKSLPPISKMITAIAAFIFFWPWIASATLMILSIFLPLDVILRGWMAPLYTSLSLPFVAIALLVSHAISLWRRQTAST
ncbi:MAG TPA: glycosyltransferase family 87 protein [Terriglobales bacterium]|nr:glycosyltransferase family 87 protein [Terriglobales bacterium]